MSSVLRVHDLGRRRYGEVLELQRTLCRERIDGTLADDLLLLVEHEPVVTLGRGTRATSLPLSADDLRRRGVDVHEVERGGDVTWHGPGQLVGYPILDLTGHREDLHWYLRTLEAALIDALAVLGVGAGRREGLTGVWTARGKIASIGVHVKRWVTLHGFALNVARALPGFDLIVPCGIHGVTMTSVAAELADERNEAVVWSDTRDAVVAAMGRAFARNPVPEAAPERLPL